MLVFKVWIGLIDSGDNRSTESSIPASCFNALSNADDAAPNRSPVFPVTIVPSSNSIATAGYTAFADFSSAALTTGLEDGVIPA